MESTQGKRALLERVRSAFLGLNRIDPVVDLEGQPRSRRRTYLDSTATTLMPDLVWQGLHDYLEASCANSHTPVHRAGRATTLAIEETRAVLGALVHKDPTRDVVLLEGNGATGAINFLSRALFPPELRAPIKRAQGEASIRLAAAFKEAMPALGDRLQRMIERPLIVLSLMEHHSNILPWIEAVGRHHVRLVGITPDGRFDMDCYKQILRDEGHRVRLVAVTGASNVTGALTPIHTIAALAHEVGAQVMIDAAQLAPHRPIWMHAGGGNDLDFVVISGHKLYAPGSRGVLIGPLESVECACVGDVGGGMVEYVSRDDFQVKQEITAREEAGTPNIPGTVALGLAARMLTSIGMDLVAEEEERLVDYALEKLRSIDGLRIYGPLDPSARVGVIALNVPGLPHAITAAYLDDAHSIAVRNDCFCAHPYVKALLECPDEIELKHRARLEEGDRSAFPGMVRLSFGIYSTRDDIDAAESALREVIKHRDRIASMYEIDKSGHPRRRGGSSPPVFSIEGSAARGGEARRPATSTVK